MEFFHIKQDIPFMRYALLFNIISLITSAMAVSFLFFRGLHLTTEFTGGTVLEIKYSHPANLEGIRQTLNKIGYSNVQVQNFGTSRDVLIRLPTSLDNLDIQIPSARESECVINALRNEDVSVNLQHAEFIGPQIGREMTMDGLLALVCMVIGITIYLSLRFEPKYAMAGIIANLHDVIIILGFFALFQWDFSPSVLAAILAVLGYSINESVVIFDRIRETFRDTDKLNISEILNHAITATMSRTIITHASTEIMVLSILIFGGPPLRYFSLALTIGILCSIYSSVFVAASLSMWFGIQRKDLIKKEYQ